MWFYHAMTAEARVSSKNDFCAVIVGLANQIGACKNKHPNGAGCLTGPALLRAFHSIDSTNIDLEEFLCRMHDPIMDAITPQARSPPVYEPEGAEGLPEYIPTPIDNLEKHTSMTEKGYVCVYV